MAITDIFQMNNNDKWLRYCDFLFSDDSLGFWIDISRMDVDKRDFEKYKDMYGNARTDLHCGGDTSVACTIWTWCPVERCFAFDIHKHEFGECWLKFQKGDNPPYTRPKDPHEGHKVYPEIMRHAPRKIWPWSVKEEIWSGPMPKEVPWMSGVLAPAETQIVSSPPNDKWRERWCAKHGPCD